jgi:dTMP kinase
MQKHPYPGLLITAEGIDGAGKTELITRLSTLLTQRGCSVIVTKEPGGTHIGKMLKKVLLEEEKECHPRVEFLLFAADRAEHFSHLIIPALKRGDIVISDRMADSALAYQGYGRGLSTELIQTVNKWAMHDIEPDMTFFVDVPVEVALQRRAKRAHTVSTMEREGSAFWHRVRAGYQTLAQTNKRFVTLDGTQTPDILAESATAHVEQLYIQKGL